MPPSLEKIRDEVRQLPVGQRVRLVTALEQDLAADESCGGMDLEDEWETEEQSRVNEIQSGQVKLLSQDDLSRRLDEIRAMHTRHEPG